MKNWRTAAFLALLLIALGGLATWDEWQTKKDEKTKETSNILISFNPDDVKSIIFANSGDADVGGDKDPSTAPIRSDKRVDVTLELRDGRWQITAPVNEPADQQVIKDMLKNIADYKYETEVATGTANWGQFGLTEPRRRIELIKNDGTKVSVVVGNNAPVGYATYIATEGSDKVYGGSQHIATSLGKTLFDFREKKILSVATFDVNDAIMTTKSGTFSLTKTDGKWLIDADKVEADSSQVNNLLDDMTGLKASEFLDAPSSEIKKSFADKSAFIFAGQLNSDSHSLKVIKHKDAYYAMRKGSDLVFKVPEDVQTKLSKSKNDLRNKRIFSFQSSNVEGVDIDGKSFKRLNDEWHLAEDSAKFDASGKFTGADADKPTAKTHVRTLLVDLEYGKAEEILPADTAKKLAPNPKNNVKLTMADKSEVTISIWQDPANPEMNYITHTGSSQVFKAKSSLVASMNDAPKLPAME
jgi:hypothetical protein